VPPRLTNRDIGSPFNPGERAAKCDGGALIIREDFGSTDVQLATASAH
jgi:hypothetical protein